ncbi:MAG: M1 family peptidase [Nitrospirae bacterium]|nr:MAG: M1 family peptidase [Nitrospirota bacterium]
MYSPGIGPSVQVLRNSMAHAPLVIIAALLLADGLALADGAMAEGAARSADLRHHELSVELLPQQHRLRVTDRMTVTVPAGAPPSFSWSLNPALHVTAVMHEGRPLRWDVQPPTGEGQAGRDRLRQVTVPLAAPVAERRELKLEVRYEGLLDDPPRESRQLRFVTPSDTEGHIGSEGVYLSGETHWYPDVEGSLPTFAVHVTLPEGWSAVTHGLQVARRVQNGHVVEDWEVTAKTEALSLVANRFVQAHRAWKAPDGRTVDVATYLFPEEAQLAEEYLAATVRYLDAYSRLLGPYPFPKFAVVENFFASGLGMPSFTLLGSGVVKRHYVQPYALGHEIVHSWIGNWVLNQREQGNWVEGLTTYLANYYYDELTGKPDQARDQRRLMLLSYAVYVRPEEDYPVAAFRQKTDQKDNAIGYQKTAMIFHQLRRELGEEVFWSAIRKLVAGYGGTYAGWADLERVFAAASGKELRWFFAQWVERPGAPLVTIAAVRADRPPEAEPESGFRLTVRIGQSGEPYRLRLRLVADLAGGRTHEAWLEVQGAEQTLSVLMPGAPVRLRLDPDFDTFRRLPREQLPPMLNLYVTDRNRTLVLPVAEPATETAPYRELGRQVAAREPAITQLTDREPVPAEGSLLILGGPMLNEGTALMRQACGERVRLERDRFTLDGTVYEGQGFALLLSCRRPDRPGSVTTLFYGLSPQAAAKVARLLFFYGWQSYVVFRDGAVVTRGDFSSVQDELEVSVEMP